MEKVVRKFRLDWIRVYLARKWKKLCLKQTFFLTDYDTNLCHILAHFEKLRKMFTRYSPKKYAN